METSSSLFSAAFAFGAGIFEQNMEEELLNLQPFQTD
jgi:hypothetical protein